MKHSIVLAFAGPALAGALALSPASAQVPAPDAPRVIQVSAQASVQRAPDRAVVQLAVETMAESAGEATSANAVLMDRVLTALRQLGIPDARIQTTRVELRPRHETRRDGTPPAIVGYHAVNQVMVRLDDVTMVGRVVDAAVGAGANRVTGVNFQLSDPDAAYHDALRLAIARAEQEARVVAESLGEALGPALVVNTGGMSGPQEMRMERLQMDVAAMETPVQPGELAVHAHVSIMYRLGS